MPPNRARPQSPPSLIDSHCHLNDVKFAVDRAGVVAGARDAGVNVQIIPSVSDQHFADVKHCCEEFAGLFPGYGLHPLFFHRHQATSLQTLERWLDQERRATPHQVVAVGECGLDYYQAKTDAETQKQSFCAQLNLARAYKLPAIVHANRAVEDVIRCIKSCQHDQGVVHSFNGSEVQARTLIDLGWKLGFGGAITYSRATRLRKLIMNLPIQSFVLETDAPYQSPAPHSDKRNEPRYLTSVLETVCELRDEPMTEIAAATTRNASKLFGL